MKKRIKKLITLSVLTITLTSNSLIVFAEDVQEPIKPTEPIGDNITNEQIVQYNQEVDSYNQQVDEYNIQIDNNYQQEKTDIDTQNAAIDEYNQAEDAKAAAIQEENEQIQNQYEEKCAQYEQDLTTYNRREQQILDLGYESVEQYNDMVTAYYNEPCEASEIGNTNDENTFNIEQSYKIENTEITEDQDQEEPIEEKKYKVEIEHNFTDSGTVVKTYKTEFEINENNIVTFMPAGMQLEVYENEYHYGFFAKIDDEHIKGYWYLGSSVLEELCNYLEHDWDTGDVYIVSYKDGQSKPGDPNLKMVYNYSWRQLKKAATYTKPEEPQLELKEEYIPVYKEKLTEPEKKEYLTHLDYLELKKENNSQSNSSDGSDEHEYYPLPAPQTITSVVPIEDEVIQTTESIVENKHIVSPQTGDIDDLTAGILFLIEIFVLFILFFAYVYYDLHK